MQVLVMSLNWYSISLKLTKIYWIIRSTLLNQQYISLK